MLHDAMRMNEALHRSLSDRWIRQIIARTRESPKLLYVGVFLTSMDQSRLIKQYGQSHGNRFAHHMTVWHFLEGDADKPNFSMLPWGRDIALKVVGYVEDDKAQAVVLQVPAKLRPSRIPHVTISTNSGVNPAYSNELIRQKWSGEPERGALSLKGKLGWFGSDDRVHFTNPE